MRVAAVFPNGSVFSADGATAMDLCLRDLLHHLPTDIEVRVFAAAVPQPFEGIDFVGIPAPDGRKVVFSALREAIAAFDPDILWVQTDFTASAKLKRAFPKAKVVLHRHRVEPTGFVKTLMRRIAYMPFIDALAYVSETARITAPFAAKKCVTIANGLDPSLYALPGIKTKRLLYAGRLAASKGVLALAEGAATFLRDAPEWSLTLLLRPDGEAQTEAKLRALIAPVAAQVTMMIEAPHDEVMRQLNTAAVALAPSLAPEGFGRFPLEAMLSGCVVVHSPVEAFREVVGETGVVVSPVTPEGITAALKALSYDPERLIALGEAARTRALSHFDIRASARALHALFVRLIG
jgi:glycosyltransferase involved in cell wall biosynthesis